MHMKLGICIDTLRNPLASGHSRGLTIDCFVDVVEGG